MNRRSVTTSIIFFCMGLSSPLFSAFFQKTIQLAPHEKCVFSQQGEDGIIAQLFKYIPPTSYFAVEFGVLPNDLFSNTKNLIMHKGFRRICWDGEQEDFSTNIYKEWVTRENINDLFRKYQVPEDVDFVSIDIDNNDFYIWQALEYRPKIVCIECNRSHGPREDKVVPYHETINRAENFDPSLPASYTDYFGASPLALLRLGRHKGYSLVYIEQNAVNMFFVRDDLIKEYNLQFKHCNILEHLYKPSPLHIPYPGETHYISSEMAFQMFPTH